MSPLSEKAVPCYWHSQQSQEAVRGPGVLVVSIKVVDANKLWTLIIAGSRAETKGGGWAFKTQQ